MDSIEQLKAKQAAELAKLEQEHAIAALAPIPPKRAMLTQCGEKAWLTYDAPSLWHALDVLKAFKPLALYKFKGTYTRVEPAALNASRTKDKGEETDGPYLAALKVSQGEGFGPSVEFSFFVELGGHICKIICDFGYSRGGQYGAAFAANERGQGERLDGRRYIRGDWRENSRVRAMADSSIKWGIGDSRSCQFGYYFASDTDDDGFASWDVDAIFRLENLARDMHGERAALIVSDRYIEREGGNGKLLIMGDGSEWFHPFGGGAPVCEKQPEVTSD